MLTVFAIWLPSRDAPTVIVFAALYGLFSGMFQRFEDVHTPKSLQTGAFVSLLATYIASITPREVYGARLGR